MALVWRGIFLGIFDLLALTFLYYVLQDLAWRASYVTSEHLTPSTAYSFFFHTFTISGGTVQFPLVSPPTLDWVEVIVVSMIIVNGYYLFQVLHRSAKGTG